MNLSRILLPAVFLPSALVAQAPAAAPTPAPSLGDQVRATRPVVEQLMAAYQFQDALQKAQALLPATPPPFDKTNNQTMLESCIRAMDLGQAYRLAVEAADAAGQWEQALAYAQQAKAIAGECYPAIKDPFTKMVDYYKADGVKAQQTLTENAKDIAALKAKKTLDPGEKQELGLALGVEKTLATDTKWAKFFQTYLDAAKVETTAYDGLITVMQSKLKGEADQIEAYKAGKGDKLKWVAAVMYDPAYLKAQGDTAGQLRWLNRLAVLDPDNKKVEHEIGVLTGKIHEPAPRRVIRKKR